MICFDFYADLNQLKAIVLSKLWKSNTLRLVAVSEEHPFYLLVVIKGNQINLLWFRMKIWLDWSSLPQWMNQQKKIFEQLTLPLDKIHTVIY